MSVDVWRKGQTAFNFVELVAPELIEDLPREANPFYDDKKLEDFWQYLREKVTHGR